MADRNFTAAGALALLALTACEAQPEGEPVARARIDGAMASMSWRVDLLGGWIALLSNAVGAADPDFVDWMAVDRFEGRDFDFVLSNHANAGVDFRQDFIESPVGCHGTSDAAFRHHDSHGWIMDVAI